MLLFGRRSFAGFNLFQSAPSPFSPTGRSQASIAKETNSQEINAALRKVKLLDEDDEEDQWLAERQAAAAAKDDEVALALRLTKEKQAELEEVRGATGCAPHRPSCGSCEESPRQPREF